MTIAIDGNEANVNHQVGVSTYTLNLLRYFNKWSNNDLNFKIFLKDDPLPHLPKEKDYFHYQVVRGNFLWSQFFLPLTLNFERNTDVFFSPAHYVPRFCPTPLVVTIHDLSYFYYPQEFLKKDLYKLQNWTKYSVERAKKIIAVSKTTKKDLMKFYQIPDGKIEVIYNGYEKLTQNNVKRLALNVIDKKYLLYVGTLQPRKNIPLLIKAFSSFKKNHPDFKLVIVGKKGWLYDEIFNETKKLGLENDVIFTDYVTDDELGALYRGAFCLVMPSLYEGFGIPILEAMSFNCPVISSFSSSLPEVGDDACLYFDPKSEADLLDKLIILKGNENLRKELIKKGKERVKLFSWQTCAEKTLAIIKNIAS